METEVIYQNGFQEQYFLADSKGKIEIILANYISFQHQLSGIEDGIKLDIKVDQDFKFRQDKGDLGIRVQTSGKSDPTAREAIRNVELDRAFDENDIERELEKTCTPDLFRNQLRMLSSMKDDYQVIKMVIATLSFKDCETLNAYFNYQKQHIKFGTVAEEKEILVSSIYQKFWRVKSKVKKNAIDKFDRKYGRITA